MNCDDCRFVEEPITEEGGPECIALVETFPAKFMRRTSGICGPAGKLWEPKHVPLPKKGRKHE